MLVAHPQRKQAVSAMNRSGRPPTQPIVGEPRNRTVDHHLGGEQLQLSAHHNHRHQHTQPRRIRHTKPVARHLKPVTRPLVPTRLTMNRTKPKHPPLTIGHVTILQPGRLQPHRDGAGPGGGAVVRGSVPRNMRGRRGGSGWFNGNRQTPHVISPPPHTQTTGTDKTNAGHTHNTSAATSTGNQ